MTKVKNSKWLEDIVKFDQEETKQDNQFCEWLNLVSLNSSLHGVNWYAKLEKRIFKMSVFLAWILVIIILPTVLSIEFWEFMNSEKITNFVEWKTQRSMNYPNLTVCHPKFFSLEKMKKYNISPELANYMIISLDISIMNYSEFTSSQMPEGMYDKITQSLDRELDQKIKENNLDNMVDLFHLIAKRCDEFIIFCDDHRKFYVSSLQASLGSLPFCCGEIFEEKPFFSTWGTCFSMKKNITETIPNIFNSVIIWLDHGVDSPDMQMVWQGSFSSNREGAVCSMTNKDFPGAMMVKEPFQIMPLTYNTASLSLRKTDRSKLSKKCSGKNETFEKIFGIPFTEINCKFSSFHFLHPNCSNAVYSGVKLSEKTYPCFPNQTIRIQGLEGVSTNPLALKLGYNITDCTSDCHEVEYDYKLSVGTLNKDSLVNYLKTSNLSLPNSLNQSMAFHVFYESFEYPENIMTEETMTEFLSKVGGWMGLALGASLFSVIEIICFFLVLIKSLIGNLFKRH